MRKQLAAIEFTAYCGGEVHLRGTAVVVEVLIVIAMLIFSVDVIELPTGLSVFNRDAALSGLSPNKKGRRLVL